ncbi:MAG: efflux RND transporter periplasmic adaptor subunit [Vulcanimicrobiaceae bacterium]
MRSAGALFFAITALAAAAGCAPHGAGSSAGASPAAKLHVVTTLARIADVPVAVSAYGTVGGGANSQALLAFPEPGRIAEVNVRIGERVAQGQVLARLDAAPFSEEVAQAQANLQAARAAYSKTAIGARPQQRAQTSAQIDEARTQLSVARASYERERSLYQAGVASFKDVDAARSALSSAQTQVHVLEEQQSAQTHPLQQDVDVANARVAQSLAQLGAARQRLAYASLTAPFDGVVIGVLHNKGESVDSSTPVVQIANAVNATFVAQFAPQDAAQVHVGDAASIDFHDLRARIPGRVTAINAAQDTTGRFVSVLIRLQRSGTAAVGSGAYGRATIAVGSTRGLIVPGTAIVSDPTTGTTILFRKKGEEYEPVPVEVKSVIGRNDWIAGRDVRAGDAVVSQGAFELLAPPAAKPDND